VAEFAGELLAVGRIGIVVSRYHLPISERLLEGARTCCRDAGIPDDAVDVVWVPGAFELGSAAATLAQSGNYGALVALGVVIRGETPHFDYVAGEAARAIGFLAATHALPIGFGLLTVNTPEQAVERAGGAMGNKGYEAAEAALRTADVIRQLQERG
jgi:6,7-dimethyl-8-ribityllumazine synthase